MAPIQTKRMKRSKRQRNRKAAGVEGRDRTKDVPTPCQSAETYKEWRKRVYVKRKKLEGEGPLAAIRARMARALRRGR